jgi:hypothetical protein
VRRKDFERDKARELRREGASLREIAHQLRVSLSSASVWVRDVPRGAIRAAELTEEPQPTQLQLEAVIRCGRCGQLLPESAFNRQSNGRQYWCRGCYRDYFRARGDLHRQQSAAAKRKRQALARGFVKDHLATHPCVDCGESDPVVLEFDHVGPKKGHVSWLAREGASVRLLAKEIQCCEVVCVNCHRRRTGLRGGWRRAAAHWWKTPPPKRYETARNFAYAYSILERSSCVDCGASEMVYLDFDHVGPKTGGVLVLAREGVGLARLGREVSNCEIRCANCHRRRTVGERSRPASSQG